MCPKRIFLQGSFRQPEQICEMHWMHPLLHPFLFIPISLTSWHIGSIHTRIPVRYAATTVFLISSLYLGIPAFPDMTKPPIAVLSYDWRLFISMSSSLIAV